MGTPGLFCERIVVVDFENIEYHRGMDELEPMAPMEGQELPKVHISTLGCRLNQFDSDALEAQALKAGYILAQDPSEADLHIVNSCSITHEADADSRKLTRRVHRQNENVQTVMTGCWGTLAPEEAAALPSVVKVVPNSQKGILFELLESGSFSGNSKAPQAEKAPEAFDDAANNAAGPDITLGSLRQSAATIRHGNDSDLEPSSKPRRSRAYLRIQDGCDYRCSFCIVPTVRGKSRSLAPGVLRQQLHRLIDAGQREICLTGVHLGTYGKDLRPRLKLADLLAELLLDVPEGVRLQLGSLDPHEVDDSLLDLMVAHQDRLCRYLHLPVQSCDDAVLRKMRRAHTRQHFIDTATKIRERLPHCAIGSDVIVGFPTETPEAFENTLQTLDALPITYLHTFSYSKRTGTVAADLPDQVDAGEKKRRNNILRELSDRKAAEFAQAQVGQVLPAFIQKTPDRHSGRSVALTDNYIRLELVGPDGQSPDTETVKGHAGTWIDVTVLEGGSGRFFGQITTPGECSP